MSAAIEGIGPLGLEAPTPILTEFPILFTMGCRVGFSTGRSRFGAVGLSLCAAFSLSGCVAAALPIMLAMTAVEGFTIYKTVQTVSGGSIKVAFPGKNGKEAPPQPLPAFRQVAVWPGNEGDVRFADRLAKSGRFDVTPPSRTSALLAQEKIATDLKQLTEAEQTTAFMSVCESSKTEFIFASRSLGAKADVNFLSFSRANTTYTADLLGFSCAQKAIVWRDQIQLIVEDGGKIPSSGEMNQAASDAWADRVLQAPAA